MDLLAAYFAGKADFEVPTWDVVPERWEALPEGGLRIHAPAGADDFVNPAGGMRDSAPFLGITLEGDFVARAHVRPTFRYTYDSAGLMARQDSTHWAKLCYESTDFGSMAAVSVVTNGVSDDANGADLIVETLWLQMCRADNLFGLHYSLDGKNWRMVRYFRLDLPSAVRVGVIAQSPSGPGAVIDILAFQVEQRRVENLRAGV